MASSSSTVTLTPKQLYGMEKTGTLISSLLATQKSMLALLNDGVAISACDTEHDPTKFIRRPTTGISLKDEEHASLSILDSKNDLAELYNSSAGEKLKSTSLNFNFILQSVTSSHAEKTQIVETFGATYIYLFGSAPVTIQCTAILLDSKDFQWRHEFLLNYSEYLRGTKLAEASSKVQLKYNGVEITGYMLGMNISENAARPNVAMVSFSIVVSDYNARKTYKGVEAVDTDYNKKSITIESVDTSNAFVNRAAQLAAEGGDGLSNFAKLSNAISSVKSSIFSSLKMAQNELYGRPIALSKEAVEGYSPETDTLPPDTKVDKDGNIIIYSEVKYTPPNNLTKIRYNSDKTWEYLIDGANGYSKDACIAYKRGYDLLQKGLNQKIDNEKNRAQAVLKFKKSLLEQGVQWDVSRWHTLAMRTAFAALQVGLSVITNDGNSPFKKPYYL